MKIEDIEQAKRELMDGILTPREWWDKWMHTLCVQINHDGVFPSLDLTNLKEAVALGQRREASMHRMLHDAVNMLRKSDMFAIDYGLEPEDNFTQSSMTIVDRLYFVILGPKPKVTPPKELEPLTSYHLTKDDDF